MRAHTPGPWEISGAALDIRANAGGMRMIASVYQPETHPLAPTDAMSVANARLIAAAPDLLAALKQSELAVAELCVGQDPANECWNILAQVRAAIAKAKGAA